LSLLADLDARAGQDGDMDIAYADGTTVAWLRNTANVPHVGGRQWFDPTAVVLYMAPSGIVPNAMVVFNLTTNGVTSVAMIVATTTDLLLFDAISSSGSPMPPRRLSSTVTSYFSVAVGDVNLDSV
jgi:hypothetical protein